MVSPQIRSDSPSGAEQLREYLAELPVLPTLVSKLVCLDMSRPSAYDEVVAIAEEDPTFAVRILSLANSAAFAPVQVIENIPQAVARIGAWRLTEMVSSMAVMDVFAPRDDSARDLWAHSVETAIGARSFASALPGVDRQAAYLFGLVHDLGRSVYLRAEAVAPELFRGMTSPILGRDQLSSRGGLVTTRELALLGFDHAEVGAQAAEVIGLTPNLVELIRHHHDELAQERDLLAAVQLADTLSVHVAHGQLDPYDPDPAAIARCYPESWVQAGVQPLEPERLAELLPRIFSQARTLVDGLSS
ncbi:MAG: HDOD domain-containing protein [Planctomycetota bacterium]|nr:HDOD domain-containing protein [Planctomycetota bacterium]